jgi:hypothetical protein
MKAFLCMPYGGSIMALAKKASKIVFTAKIIILDV